MIRKLFGTSILTAAVFLLCITPIWAGIPQTMAFQGRLTDQSEKVLDGNFAVTFRIYDAATAGTKLWEETKTLTVTTGLFSTLLGSTTALNLPFDKPYWVEIQVGTELLTPRQALASSAYTFRAQKLDGINVVSGNVGIGIENPAAPLHVNGEIRSPGAFHAVGGGGGSDGWIRSHPVANFMEIGTLNASDTVLMTHSSEKIRITSAGTVGIGTAAPDLKLHVYGTGGWLTQVGDKAVGSNLNLRISPNALGAFAGGNPSNLLFNPDGGNVGIGITAPRARLEVNGAVLATGYQGSSIALKTDIHRLTPSQEQDLLTKVARLPLYRYRLKNPDGLKSTHLGVLAEETLPELVDDQHKAMSYGDSLAVLMAGLKAQQREIGALRKEIDQLKARQQN